jgi:hypothetical protein
VHENSKISWTEEYRKDRKKKINIIKVHLYSLALNLFVSFIANPIFNYWLLSPIDYINVISP